MGFKRVFIVFISIFVAILVNPSFSSAADVQIVASGRTILSDGGLSSIRTDRLQLGLNEYGNLTLRLRATNAVIWQSRTDLRTLGVSRCGGQCRFALNSNGNLMIYYGSTALWSSRTTTNGAKLVLSDSNPSLSVRDVDGNIRWQSDAQLESTRTFLPGEFELGTNQKIETTQYQYVLQTDGNFVIYDRSGQPRFASNTSRYEGFCNFSNRCVLKYQTDGNIVLYHGVQPVWASNTVSFATQRLVLHNSYPFFSVQSMGATPKYVDRNLAEFYYRNLASRPKGFGETCSNRTAWNAISTAPENQVKVAKILAAADKLVPQVLPVWNDEAYLEFSRSGNRTVGEAMVRARSSWISPLTLAYCLTGNAKYSTRLLEVLNAVLEEPTWVLPAHDSLAVNFRQQQYFVDLNSSATAHQVAQSLYLLDGKASYALRKKALDTIGKKVFAPILSSLDREGLAKGPHWWLPGKNNWNAVCLRGLVGAAMTILPSIEDRAVFGAIGRQYVANYIDGFTDDGYSSEGLGYWNYGFSNFAELREVLYQATSRKEDLYKIAPRMRNIVQFPLNYEMYKNVAAAFGDSGNTAVADRQTLAHALGALGLPVETDASIQRTSIGVTWDAMAFFKTDALHVKRGLASVGQTSYFPNASVVVSRSADAQNLPMAISVKAGDGGFEHGHRDIGSYALSFGTTPFVGDPGGHRQYSAQTFSDRRFEFKLLNSWGHPVPVVAGQTQIQTSHLAGRNIVARSLGGEVDDFIVNLRDAYAVKMNRLDRWVRHLKNKNEIVIKDHFAASSPIHFQVPIILQGVWSRSSSGMADGTYVVQPRSDSLSRIVFMKGFETFTVDISASAPFRISQEVIVEGGVTITRVAVSMAQRQTDGWVRMSYRRLAVSAKRVCFEPREYLEMNTDLKKAFGSITAAATAHWLDYGMKEGRVGCYKLAPQVFNAQWYLRGHSDLAGMTAEEASRHWIKTGIGQGRQAHASFHSKVYLARNKDLSSAFGSKGYLAAVEHYIKYGLRENRVAVNPVSNR